LKEAGDSPLSGTTVSFKPDGTIFDTVEFIEATEVARMKRGAYLTPGVTFTLVNKISGLHKRFRFDG
jgi:DNA gyrase/topoisomerase IV subunit B